MGTAWISRTIAAIVLVAAAVVFVWTLVHALFIAPGDHFVAAAQMPYTVATSSSPVRLIIPVLNINANVQDVGVNAQGAMRAPDNFTDVAWYDQGPMPGQLGSAVIDGHVDNGLGLPGVFKHLSDIKVDDDVYVQEKDGSQLHFKVTDIATYPYQSAPTGLIFGETDAARLNLITCEGTWVPGGDTYDHRLVVFTELQST